MFEGIFIYLMFVDYSELSISMFNMLNLGNEKKNGINIDIYFLGNQFFLGY